MHRRFLWSFASMLLLSFGQAIAASMPPPESACTMLNDFGLKTRGWKDLGGGMYGCSSPYNDIGTGYPLANNLAYYVTGTKAGLQRVKLVVNVNNKAQGSEALRELSAAARLLTLRLTGGALSPSLNESILKGRKAKASVRGVNVEIVRDNWANGNGYEVQVIYQ